MCLALHVLRLIGTLLLAPWGWPDVTHKGLGSSLIRVDVTICSPYNRLGWMLSAAPNAAVGGSSPKKECCSVGSFRQDDDVLVVKIRYVTVREAVGENSLVPLV